MTQEFLNMRRSLAVMLVALMSATGFVGCAQDVGDIDRTQPNKLRKQVFEGEWYMRQTISQVPGTAMSGFVGLEGSVERVQFVIQENALVAHRVHEDVLGIDTGGIPTLESESPEFAGVENGLDYRGAPVAAWPIIGQFDVQRAYNAMTGEQQNIIVENYSDRHWTEREWLRVSWGTNMAPMFWEPMVGLSWASNLSWYEAGSDQASPLYIECKDAEGNFYDCDPDNLGVDEEVAYIEIEQAYVVAPSWIDCILTFGFPMYGGDCGPETIRAKVSLVKADREEVAKYEPRAYSDNELDWFGYFRTERCAYDRLYGCRDQGRVTLANRHRIWENWKDDSGNTIPYAQREVEPIVYYLNADFPIDLLDESIEIADQYDDAFREIVASTGNPYTGRMYYLCANSEDQLADLEARKDEFYIGDNLSNPWRPGLDNADALIAELRQGYTDGACLRPDKEKEVGDLRYSYFYWVQNPQQVGPLGYGPSSTDPLTGETFTADAYIYGSGIDTYAQYTVDIVDLLNGDLDPVEFGMGENIDGYLKDVFDKFGIPEKGGSLGNMPLNELKKLEVERQDEFARKMKVVKDRHDAGGFEKLVNFPAHRMERKVDNYYAIWERLKGTDLEAMFVTPEIKAGLGAGLISPDQTTNEEVIDQIGPRRVGIVHTANGARQPFEHLRQDDYWARFDKFASRNMYMAEFLDDGILGLAISLKEKYAGMDPVQRRLRMFYDIRGMIYKHVMEHEVGHTVGLRHNFEASFDAMNYNPRYWEIRFQSDAELGYEHHKADRGITLLDESNSMHEYAYSSTMDYGPRPNSQSRGIGLYDKAALAYGYADLVHVFKQGSEPRKVEGDINFVAGGGYYTFDTAAGVRRSSQVVTDWEDVDELYADGGTDDTNSEDWGMDFWHYSVLPVMFTDEYANPAGGNMDAMYDREFISVDEFNPEDPTRTRVPYRFCSDELRGATPMCNVWDVGADYNEITKYYQQTYDSYYFHNSYRRGRAAWGLWIWPHLNRLLYRYFSPIATMYQHWRIRASVYGTVWVTSPWAGELLEAGVDDGLRTLLNVVAAPAPGTYVYNSDNNNYEHLTSTVGYRDSGLPEFDSAGEPNYIDLDPGIKAKWRFSRFDFDSGYYYFLRYSILSSFWDRWAALMALTNPVYNTVGVDASSNINAFSIPYYLDYDYELSRFIGSVITEDYNGFAPLVDYQGDADLADAVKYQDPLVSAFDQQQQASMRKLNPYPADYGNSSFNDRYFGMLYSLSFFQVLWDQSFNHSSNIFYEGTGDSFTIPDAVKQESSYEDYTDPFNHKTYAAIEFSEDIGFGRKVYSPGIQLIRKAKRLQAEWEATGDITKKWDLQNVTQDMDLIIRMNRVFMNQF